MKIFTWLPCECYTFYRKIISTKVTYFLNIYYHTPFHDPKLCHSHLTSSCVYVVLINCRKLKSSRLGQPTMA